MLTAMGLAAERARASIRFSLGKQNTAEEVEFALALVPEMVARLRELVPVWRKRRGPLDCSRRERTAEGFFTDRSPEFAQKCCDR